MLEYELQKSPVNGRLWYVGGTRGAGECTAALRCRRVQKVRAAIICTTTHPPRHILQSCTRQTRKHRIFPTWSRKCFPQTISASNKLHRVCLPFQLTSRWERNKWRAWHWWILAFSKEVLFSIGNEKAFLVGTRSSSSWSRPDLEMQFQTRSIVPNYFERSLPALTRCQYLLLFLLTLWWELFLDCWFE